MQGECEEEDLGSLPSVDYPDENAFAGRKRRQARRGSSQTSCDNSAVQTVRVKVVGQQELAVLPAQVRLDSITV